MKLNTHSIILHFRSNKKMTAIFSRLLLFIFAGFLNYPIYAQQDTAAYPWPQGKLAALSLSFDDARESQVLVGTNLLNQYGIKATFFVEAPAVEKQLEGWK